MNLYKLNKQLLLAFFALTLAGCSTLPKTETNVSINNDLKESAHQQCNAYARSKLNTALREDYDVLLNAYMQFTTSTQLTTTDIKEVDKLIEAILGDHPEIFWVGASYEYMQGKLFDKAIKLYPSYQYTKEQMKEHQLKLMEVTAPIIAKAQSLTNDYEKVKYIYDYIIDTTSYVEGDDDQNILSTFLQQKTVCAGYAKGMKYLLDQLAIPSAFILGRAIDNPDVLHSWNLVQMDNEYYYVDATFGDNEISEQMKNYRYAYFAMNSDAVKHTYLPNSKVEETSAIKDNFFVRTNAYVDAYDEQQLLTMLRSNLKDGNDILYYQCKDSATYDLMKAKLIHDGQIYTLLQEANYPVNKVAYYEFKNNNIIYISFTS